MPRVIRGRGPYNGVTSDDSWVVATDVGGATTMEYGCVGYEKRRRKERKIKEKGKG